jgi:rhamnopyranosyl-N-acetylglucosaminyl-diphospho-decaprenol beta-1,3/1,4-galactofuranosyltransferase
MTQHDIIESGPIVFALVVTYNRAAHLAECLDALSRQTLPVAKIVVVDNASTDETEELMAEYVAKTVGIEYMRLPSNTGGSGGFHIGMQYLSDREFDFAWIMDDDVAAEEDCLETLLRHREKYDVLQPVRRYYDDNFVVSEPLSVNLCNPFLPLKRDIISDPEVLDEVTQIAAVPFEGPLISRAALQETGLPEYDYFIIADDTEYSIRLACQGFRMGLVKHAVLRRQILPARGERNLTWKFVHHLRNHFDIDRKHGSPIVRNLRPLLLTVYYVVTSIIRRRSANSFRMIAAAWVKK